MAKKKSIYMLAFLLIVIVLSVFVLSKFIHRREAVKSAYQSIPTFSLPDINGQMITEKSLPKQVPVLFLFFNSECELCHEELEQIRIHQEAFYPYSIVFFSVEPAGTIQRFLRNLHFIPTDNLFFLMDFYELLVNTLEIKGTPTSIIYDRNGKLVKRFDGPVKVETLIKYLSENP